MAKAQHTPEYRPVPRRLRDLREGAGLTQRELGGLVRRPQSWVYNCETGSRRVDVTEFAAWCRACDVDPGRAFAELLADLPPRPPRLAPRGKSKQPRRRKAR